MAKIETKVFCILGDERVFRAKSYVMFSEVLKQIDVKGAYVPFMVEAGNNWRGHEKSQDIERRRCQHHSAL